ncbi:hypothetical protein HC248_03369 [Polaromonas vacuolata]|uniref:ABC3 transporter permease protein domain-containing protein n=1 Tax=Polaromonas vacuolata TaxID=37448 RepID=A0A6H2HDT4_9BURK|nr:ABC transporter permease [Polaromonas vacuolata]QJC58032.1 hypothetical protein HC248_03369 [Polaromonas vacuolata]
MNPFPFVVAEWRHARGVLIAMALLIAIASAISLGVTSLERALRTASANAAGRFDLIIGAAGSQTQLVLTTVYLQPAALKLMPATVLAQLRADPGVVFAEPVVTGDSYAGFSIVGTSAALASDHGRLLLSSGRWFAGMQEAVAGSATTLKIGESYTPLHGSASDNLIEAHAHDGQRVVIVGRAAATGTPWDKAIIVPYEAVLALHEVKVGVAPKHALPALGLPAIVVKPRSIMDAYRLRNVYRNSETTAVFPAETLTRLYQTLGDVRALALWIAGAGQSLVLAAVLLGLYASLSARAQSLISLRAIGAGPLFVWLTLWLQVLGILLVGALLGLLGGWLLAFAGAGVLSNRLGLLLTAELTREDLLPLVWMLAAGTVASAGVAWRAYVKAPAQAMRSG